MIYAVIILLVCGAAFWGIWVLLTRIANNVISSIGGIILILIWILIALNITGVYRLSH